MRRPEFMRTVPPPLTPLLNPHQFRADHESLPRPFRAPPRIHEDHSLPPLTPSLTLINSGRIMNHFPAPFVRRPEFMRTVPPPLTPLLNPHQFRADHESLPRPFRAPPRIHEDHSLPPLTPSLTLINSGRIMNHFPAPFVRRPEFMRTVPSPPSHHSLTLINSGRIMNHFPAPFVRRPEFMRTVPSPPSHHSLTLINSGRIMNHIPAPSCAAQNS
jgi:hypothetical protein